MQLSGWIILIIVVICLAPVPLMLLWNWLMPILFSLPEITYFQAAGLFLLSGIFFGPKQLALKDKD